MTDTRSERNKKKRRRREDTNTLLNTLPVASCYKTIETFIQSNPSSIQIKSSLIRIVYILIYGWTPKERKKSIGWTKIASRSTLSAHWTILKMQTQLKIE